MKKKYHIVRVLLLLLLALLCFDSHLLAKNHQLFTNVLRKHVNNGSVRYRTLKRDPNFGRYIAQLSATNPHSIKGSKAKLAFWINTYNAFTLKLITDHYPLKSISDLHGSVISRAVGNTIWKTWKFKIYNKTYTLDRIEHKIIRVKFKEPRIHAALVCAAKSCPPLRSEAFEARKLDRQLASQMRTWLGNSKLNRYDSKKKKLYLSKIFSWFQSDFANTPAKLIKYTLPYWPTSTRKKLQQYKNLKDIKISYLKYDWSLNEAK